MGSLSLLSGPAHPDKEERLLARARQRLQQGRGDSFLFLVPTRSAALHLRHHLLESSRAPLRLPPRVLAPADLAAALLPATTPRRALLPLPARRLLAAALLAGREPGAEHFRTLSGRPSPGLAAALERFFAECEEGGVEPADLVGESLRAREARALYQEWQTQLGAVWTAPGPALLRAAACLDEGSFSRLFPGVDLLLLSGFAAFSRPLQAILEKLLAIVPESLASVDWAEGRSRLFAAARPARDFLGARTLRTEPFSPPCSGQALAPLEPHLFARDGARNLQAPVQLFKAADRLTEVEQIARDIRLLHRRGAPLASMRLAFPDPDLYAPLLAEVLPRHGIPFHLVGGRPLDRAPLLLAAQAVLDLVLEGYSRAALLRLLCLPWVRFRRAAPGGGSALSAADFDTWSRSLPPTAGRRNWRQVLARRCAFLERELALAAGGGPLSEEIDDPAQWQEALRQELEGLRPLQEDLQALFDLLAPLERPLTPAAFRRHLLAILERLGVRRELERLADPEAGRVFARFGHLLDACCAAVGPPRRWSLGELAEWLRDGLSRTRLYERQPRGVPVSTLQAGAPPCDHLFVGGLVEGEMPRLLPADLFLGEEERQQLGLERFETQLPAERLRFYQTIAAARQSLALLYPLREGDTALSPSPFLEEIEALLSERESPRPAGPFFAVAPLHAFLGQGLGGDPERAPEALDLFRQGLGLPALQAPLRRLLRGVALEQVRGRPEGLSAYEGLVDEASLLASLRRRLGPRHAFSATQLETYGRCPFRFFAARLLGLAPLPDPEEDRSALERGNLVHRILYYFYEERRRHGSVEPVTRENLQEAIAQLQRVGERQAREMHLEDFFWERELERLLDGGERSGREGVLVRFLRQQAAAPDPARPAHFELSFGSYPGMGPRDPLSTSRSCTLTDPGGGDEVRLLGKIDRIDRTLEGAFLVIDYKTGQPPSNADIERGLNLQLPLYLLAAEALFGEAGLGRGAAAFYYQLRDLENCGRSGLLADAQLRDRAYSATSRQGLFEPEAFRHLLDQVRGFARRYARAMRQGRFPVTRHEPARICPRCPYAQTCRLDSRRMRELERQDRLP